MRKVNVNEVKQYRRDHQCGLKEAFKAVKAKVRAYNIEVLMFRVKETYDKQVILDILELIKKGD